MPTRTFARIAERSDKIGHILKTALVEHGVAFSSSAEDLEEYRKVYEKRLDTDGVKHANLMKNQERGTSGGYEIDGYREAVKNGRNVRDATDDERKRFYDAIEQSKPNPIDYALCPTPYERARDFIRANFGSEPGL